MSVTNVDTATPSTHTRAKSDFFVKQTNTTTSINFVEPHTFNKQRMQSIASIQKLVDECNDFMNTNENFYK